MSCLAVLLAGCSVVWMKKPPARHGAWHANCTDKRTMPIIDTVVAAAAAVAYTGIMINASTKDCVSHTAGCSNLASIAPGATILFVPIVVGFGSSAALGYVWASRCDERRHEQYVPLDQTETTVEVEQVP